VSSSVCVLPPGVPAPVDDGACDHLPGTASPPLALPSTAGGAARRDEIGRGRAVLLFYPRAGEAGGPAGPGGDGQGRIEEVRDPVSPRDRNAETVPAWLAERDRLDGPGRPEVALA
jgi:hypothetical protein